jgi:sec-independent protein translocase protein TatC
MLGTTELLVVAIVGLIVVDPKKLPDLMKGLGRALAEFKQMSGDVKRTFEREAEMADFEKRKAEAHEQLYGDKAAQAAGEPAAAEPAAAAPAAAEPAEAEPETPIETMDQPEDAAAEPAVEPAAEPAADSTAEDQAEPSAEGEAVAESVAEPAAEPTETPAAAAPVAEPAQTPAAAEPEPVAEAAAENVEAAVPPVASAPAQPPVASAPAQPPAEAAPAETPAEAAPPPPPPPPPPVGDEAVGEGQSARMSFIGHLQDLRKGVTRSLFAILAGFLICYAFAGNLLKILMQPMLSVLKQSHFIYTLPTEAFFAEMWIAFVAGMFLASPYIFYQIWGFVTPGLYSHERRWIIPIALCSALFFTFGALFGYFVVFPFGFEFFASYASDILFFTPKLDEYLGFALKLLFAFGVVFELPLFMFFLARLGLVTHEGLRAKRKYAILGSFIVAAALTPPDAISQTMMALPLCVLYEVGIWGAFFSGKKKKPEPTDETATPPGEAAA